MKKVLSWGLGILSVGLFGWALGRYVTHAPTPPSAQLRPAHTAATAKRSPPGSYQAAGRPAASPYWKKDQYVVPRSFVREPLPLDGLATPLLIKDLQPGHSYALVHTGERISLWETQRTLRAWCHLGAFQFVRAEHGNLVFSSFAGEKAHQASKVASLVGALDQKLEIQMFPVRSGFVQGLLPCRYWVEIEKVSSATAKRRMSQALHPLSGQEELKIGQCKKVPLSQVAVFAYEDTQVLEIKRPSLKEPLLLCAHTPGFAKIRLLDSANGSIYQTKIHVKAKSKNKRKLK